jgi:hypothetical protein
MLIIELETHNMSAETVMTSDSTPITPESIMQLGLGFWGSKTLLSAIE